MLKIDSSIKLPSERLLGSKLKNCYFLGLDCFKYSTNEIFFSSPEEIKFSECLIIAISDKNLVECYALEKRIEDSDCYEYSFLFNFQKEEFNSEQFVSDILKVDFLELHNKLILLNG